MSLLYHYTSLETLALILKNKTIRFNTLSAVDDLEEAKTKDMGSFGQYAYVSCWTKSAEESIPLWKMYTSDMTGVRIALPEYPFVRHHYTEGNFYFIKDVDTYINYQQVFEDDKVSIVATDPHLEEIQYTNDENDLFPVIKHESYPGIVDDFLNNCASEGSFSYDLQKLGKYKRNIWSFQEEVRYIIMAMPMGMKEKLSFDGNANKELIRRLNCLELTCTDMYLELDNDALSSLQVTLGPKMNESQTLLLQSLLHEYCPNAKVRESSLKNKIR